MSPNQHLVQCIVHILDALDNIQSPDMVKQYQTMARTSLWEYFVGTEG